MYIYIYMTAGSSKTNKVILPSALIIHPTIVMSMNS